MINHNVKLIAIYALSAAVCSAADVKKDTEKQAATPVATPPSGMMFSTNMSGGQAKSAPFSAEISADFIKKVQETSARIEECKKEIAERQAYLYESNPQVKAYRSQMIEMQTKINQLLETDKELADLRLNRDILWTTMPVFPKGRDQRLGPPRGPIGK